MRQPATLSSDLTLSPAEDYDFLRQEGIRRLQALAGQTWTDHNTHDPGITILEQLCYALTDLAYRIGHPLPDLLAEPDGQAFAPSLYTARQILSVRPVSLDDYRRLLLDLEGVKNAWVEPVALPLPMLRLQASDLLLAAPSDPEPQKMPLKGLLRVKIEPDTPFDADDEEAFREALRQRVASQLLATRNLGEDLNGIDVLPPENLRIEAEIEAAEGVDAADLLVEIYTRLDRFISPRLRFYSLREMLDKGYASDEIIEGTALAHGYLDPAELDNFAKKEYLRGSDLIGVLMEIPGVRLVRQLRMVVLDQNGLPAKSDAWSVSLHRDRFPLLLIPKEAEVPGTPLIQLKRGPFRLNPTGFRDKWEKLQARLRPLSPAQDELDAAPRPGRYRHPGAYQSIQRQFPLLYGVGEAGLPQHVGPQRQAEARQLKAYLLFFDQLLANGFAQLEGFRTLFSFDHPGLRTYFSQVPDDVPALASVLAEGREQLAGLLPALAEPAGAAGANSRIHRLFNHLLARFGEQFPDHNLLHAGAGPDEAQQLELKKTLLRQYPALSGGRGQGVNYAGAPDVSNLERRIALLLGIPPSDAQPLHQHVREGCWLLEHVLLRPLPADRAQYERDTLPGPATSPGSPLFLYQPAQADVFSLQLSVVFPAWPGRFADPDFRTLAERLVRTEAPAHLRVNVYWLDPATMKRVELSLFAWRQQLRTLGRPLSAAVPAGATGLDEPLLRVRAARNRLIDSLVLASLPFGYTYPLLDLPLEGPGRILEGERASIMLRFSEPGVSYRLWDRNRQAWSGAAVAGTGEEEAITLLSDPLGTDIKQADETALTQFDVAALKTVAGRTLPERWLQRTIGVGIRLLQWDLVVEIAAGQTEIDYDGGTVVRIRQPQVGVQYTLHTAPLQDGDYEYFRRDDGTLAYRINQPRVAAVEKQRAYARQEGLTGAVDQASDFLDITIPAKSKILPEDAILKVEASFGGEGVREFLDARVFVFVRPNPGVKATQDPDNDGRVLIKQPQAGVRYTLFLPGGTPVAAQAYLSAKGLAKTGEDDAQTALRTEVDFVLNAVTEAPLVLPLPALTATTTFTLKAQKLNTKLEAALADVKITVK